jgi:hypothetical protein
MAKKPAKSSSVNVVLLTAIASAPETAAYRVTQNEAASLEGLIEVNTADIVEGKALARVTDAGIAYLKNISNPTEENKGKPMYGIMTDIPVPASNRGNRKGAGAPTVYPFADMPVGGSFFVPNSDKADAAKKLQSTVSAQNHKYSEATGETETVEVTKRGKGNKAELDAAGNKIKETVTRPIRKPVRKFVLRPITKGQVLGNWTAPDDGALIAREV